MAAYLREATMTGSPEKALDLARQTFVDHGFRLEESSAQRLVATNHRMPNNNRNPVLAVSDITVDVSGGRLSVEAEFRNARKLFLFVGAFIAGIAVFFLLLFGVLFGGGVVEGEGLFPLVVILPFLPWPFLLPVMAWLFRRSAERNLDTLVDNMVTVSGGAKQEGVGKVQTRSNALPLAIGLICIIGAVASLGWSLRSMVTQNRMEPVELAVPGTTELELDQPGPYILFNVVEGNHSPGSPVTERPLQGIRITMSSEEGETVPVVRMRPTTESRNSRRTRYSAYRFRVEQPGTYSIETEYSEIPPVGPARLVVEKQSPILNALIFLIPMTLFLVGIMILVGGFQQRTRTGVR